MHYVFCLYKYIKEIIIPIFYIVETKLESDKMSLSYLCCMTHTHLSVLWSSSIYQLTISDQVVNMNESCRKSCDITL